ncbi:hypothetical protein KHC17_01535 [Agrobacterium salinitolerans]|uniref:hypothetical protein n=1 Tax=Agrobacterium TaxID=357 RepID=UPI001C22E430|nr:MULTISPECIES: hypothetical protein [Agrobacterium]MDP9791344.1 hypothetical protein [Agrobacterium tumefaciens]MDP9855276.1 hypothetical protein [Agrobacterium tumefaciens]QXC48820.1 hypothetical protein KHC17_01535 [Agrobacterium salinitolerans]
MNILTRLGQLKQHLIPGKVYRRSDLARWITPVDRDLRKLMDAGELTKLSGVYIRPKTTSFGNAPARDHDLVETFLKDNPFLLLTPNVYMRSVSGLRGFTTKPLSITENATTPSNSATASLISG